MLEDALLCFHFTLWFVGLWLLIVLSVLFEGFPERRVGLSRQLVVVPLCEYFLPVAVVLARDPSFIIAILLPFDSAKESIVLLTANECL